MKKTVFLLVMLLIAAASFGQTERRTSNTEKSAQKNNRTRTETSKEQTSKRQKSSATTNTKPERQDRQPARTKRPEDKSKPKNQSPQRRDDRQRTEVNKSRAMERTAPPAQARSHAAHTVPHKDYSSPRVYRDRHEVKHYYHTPPQNRSYRSIHYVYRAPVNYHVVWTPVMHRRYLEIYPMIKVWYYPAGYQIESISAYDALYYKGEVMNVYGRVNEVFYSHATDEYFLYFGPYYPYQDFTVVLPGRIARSYSTQPIRYFDNQYIVATGLITSFEDVPEIVVQDRIQVNMY